MDVLQQVEVSVPANASATRLQKTVNGTPVYVATTDWTATGVSLNPGDSLRIEASGFVKYGRHDDERAYPEGSYRYVNEGRDLYHALQPDRVDSYGQCGGNFLVSNTIPLSLVAVVSHTKPNFSAGNLGLRCNRDTTFGPSDLPAQGGAVWLAFNEKIGNYGDDSGFFDVTVSRLGIASPLMPGLVSPVRFVPLDIAREHLKSICQTAICWFIRPKAGPCEGYTEYDTALNCPAIAFQTGTADDGVTPLYTNLPALTYRPFSGLSLSGIPTSVKLGVDAADARAIRFDHEKLRREYYEEAEVEVFEIPLLGDRSQPLMLLSGVMGNAQGNDLEATIELTPYDELTNLASGQCFSFLCDVGRLPDERFGTKRCLNEKKRDGIDIANWTRGAMVIGTAGTSRLILASATVGSWHGFESTFPGGHGIIQFAGGALDGLKRDCGKFDGGTGTLDLRRALPTPPNIGDMLTFEAGCDRSFNGAQGCKFWQAGRNFRGTPHLPGRAALSRRIVL